MMTLLVVLAVAVVAGVQMVNNNHTAAMGK